MNNYCPLSGLELFRVELVVFTWLIGLSMPNHPEELPRCDCNLHTSPATPAALSLLFELLRCPQTYWVCLIQSTGNLCGLSSTDTNASGTDTQSSRNTSNRDYTVSSRDHCNQAISWTLCDATSLSYGREDEFHSFSYLSSPAIHHMPISGCWPLRAEEQLIKRGVITCEIPIILCPKSSMRSHWPVCRFSISIDLFNLLTAYP